MSTLNLRSSDPRALSKLMKLDTSTDGLWDHSDLAAVWQHQLSATLEFDLTIKDPGQKRRIATLSTSTGRPLRTFRDLLYHANPPVELLRLTKVFAKASPKDKDRPLPNGIAAALYYSSIVAAFIRCGERITRLTNLELREGVKWAVAQPWLDDPTRALFQEGLKRLPA